MQGASDGARKRRQGDLIRGFYTGTGENEEEGASLIAGGLGRKGWTERGQ